MAREPEQGGGPLWLSALDQGVTIGLIGPLVAYLLYMKVMRLFQHGLHAPGPLGLADLLRSDLLVYAGILLTFFAVAVLTPRGIGVWVARTVHVATWALVAFIEVLCFRVFTSSGVVPDWPLTSYFLGKLSEVLVVLQTQGRPVLWTIIIVALALGVIGAFWLLSKRLGGARMPVYPLRQRTGRAALLGAGGLGCLLLAFAPRLTSAGSDSVGLQSSVYLVVTGLRPTLDVPAEVVASAPAFVAPVIAPRPMAHRPNLVLIPLESTRARSVTAYEPGIGTTPFLAELAQHSLVAEQAYTVVPHTTKAMVASLCGIVPLLHQPVMEADPDGMPIPCLAELLREQGYHTVFFRSATEHFENWRGLVGNMGFTDFLPSESMDTEGFELANYFGWEDDIMLEPSRAWLEAHRDAPFFALYNTGTPHHDYLAPSRYGYQAFHPDEEENRYLNSIWYLDHFLNNLFDQYKELGLYDDTVFVLFGDHGEGFGEHLEKQHNACVYAESLHIPLLIHHGERWVGRIEPIVNQHDLVPTSLELLGFDLVEPGSLDGISVLGDLPDRTLYAACWYDNKCLASVQGDLKLVYWFDDKAAELYDLRADPQELRDLAAERPEVVAARRLDLLGWYAAHKAQFVRFLGGI